MKNFDYQNLISIYKSNQVICKMFNEILKIDIKNTQNVYDYFDIVKNIFFNQLNSNDEQIKLLETKLNEEINNSNTKLN